MPTVPATAATTTATPPPLALFPGFVDTGCVWGIPLGQLLDCLSKKTGTVLQASDGSYVASRASFRAADGRTFEMNVLSQAGRVLRNIQGTTFWDLSILTPTPTATPTLAATATLTAVPQLTIGALRFYGFEPGEIQFILQTFEWVRQVDPATYGVWSKVTVSIYRVEPDLLSSVAAVSGLSLAGAGSVRDMQTPFAADRIEIRSDYMRATIAQAQGLTPESNQISFFALLARQLQHVQDYRAYRTAGKPLATCAQITVQLEQTFEAAGFNAQLEAVQRLATNAFEKGRIAPQDKPAEREQKRRFFKAETDQWIADLRWIVQNPQYYALLCHPPTPTPKPSATPIPPTPTIPPGMGVLVVFNPWEDATITINGPSYRVPALGEIRINLPPGRHAYSVNVSGRSASGVVEIKAGQYIEFQLPQPQAPETEPPKTRGAEKAPRH